jgi:hypothetical protein
MLVITKPSAIRFRGNIAKYCYNCPKCNKTLSKRAAVSYFMKKLLLWLPLKKYVCELCAKEYYVYATMYGIKPATRLLEYRLDLPELSPVKQRTAKTDRTMLNHIAYQILQANI